MVFLIRRSQNKDAVAIHLKLTRSWRRCKALAQLSRESGRQDRVSARVSS